MGAIFDVANSMSIYERFCRKTLLWVQFSILQILCQFTNVIMEHYYWMQLLMSQFQCRFMNVIIGYADKTLLSPLGSCFISLYNA